MADEPNRDDRPAIPDTVEGLLGQLANNDLEQARELGRTVGAFYQGALEVVGEDNTGAALVLTRNWVGLLFERHDDDEEGSG